MAMTITVKIAQLKDRLSEHLRAVEKGAEVIVTHRDRPIARIVPIEHPRRIKVMPPKGDFSVARRRSFRPARWKLSSTELLLEERRQR